MGAHMLVGIGGGGARASGGVEGALAGGGMAFVTEVERAGWPPGDGPPAVAVAVVAGAVRTAAGQLVGAIGVVGIGAQTAEVEVDPAVGVVQGIGVAAAAMTDAAVEAGYPVNGMLAVAARGVRVDMAAAAR